jgi:hypothetical protein
MKTKYSLTGLVVGYSFLLFTLLFFALPNYSFAQSALISVASDQRVVEGNPVVPAWSCICNATAGGGMVPCVSRSATPLGPTTGLVAGDSVAFALSCEGPGGVTDSDSVTVNIIASAVPPSVGGGSLPPAVGDDPSGLVPCGGINCSFCHLVQLGQLVLNWIFGIVFVIFGVIMVVAGFGLVTSGGNQSELDRAKQKFSNAIIGIIIVFAAWLIVDTLLKAVIPGDGNLSGVNAELGMWHTIRCDLARQE